MPKIEHHKPGSFSWFELATSDQPAAKSFYGSLFGWTAMDFPMGPNDFYTMFRLDDANVAAALTIRPDQQSQGSRPHWGIYIAVESADETAAKAASLGGKIFGAPMDVFNFGRMGVIADPTGAVFFIWQAKGHIGTGITGVDGTACWADLSTNDTDTAAKFYQALFGWEILTSPQDTSGYLHIKNDGEFIGGVPPAEYHNPQIPPHWLVYFQTSDCQGLTTTAASLGAQTVSPPSDVPGVGRMAILRDPQGAVLALFEQLAK